MPEESTKVPSAVVRLEDQLETEYPHLDQSIENTVDDMGTTLKPHLTQTESVVDQMKIQDAIQIDTSTLNQNKNRAEIADVFNKVFADEVKFQVDNARVGQAVPIQHYADV